MFQRPADTLAAVPDRAFGGAHFGRVAHIVEKDVAFDPADVSLLPSAGSGQAVRMD